jgi:uncharacterized protein YjbJ (UPF0337 family)
MFLAFGEENVQIWNACGYHGHVGGTCTATEHRACSGQSRIQGSAVQAKGKVKEALGKATGDSKLEGEGKADQFNGKVQNAVGGLKDFAGQVDPFTGQYLIRRFPLTWSLVIPSLCTRRLVPKLTPPSAITPRHLLRHFQYIPGHISSFDTPK